MGLLRYVTPKHKVSTVACVNVCKHQTAKVGVQNVLHVLEYKLEHVDATGTVWSLHRWPPGGGNVHTLRSDAIGACSK